MQQETAAVIRAMEPMMRLERERVERFRTRETQLRDRLDHLARARTEYAKIDAEVKHRTALLADAERLLAEANASRSAALSTNLISSLGPPQVTESPIGPGGSVLTLGSAMAGLIFGLGTVFLVAPGPTEIRSGRRWSDYLGTGRRRSDLVLEPAGADRRRGPAIASTSIDKA
jgi:uncharacterized protein involved in exopolysaccharide biosynthesis